MRRQGKGFTALLPGGGVHMGYGARLLNSLQWKNNSKVPTWDIPTDVKGGMPPGRSDAALGAREWGLPILRDFLILSWAQVVRNNRTKSWTWPCFQQDVGLQACRGLFQLKPFYGHVAACSIHSTERTFMLVVTWGTSDEHILFLTYGTAQMYDSSHSYQVLQKDAIWEWSLSTERDASTKTGLTTKLYRK